MISIKAIVYPCSEKVSLINFPNLIYKYHRNAKCKSKHILTSKKIWLLLLLNSTQLVLLTKGFLYQMASNGELGVFFVAIPKKIKIVALPVIGDALMFMWRHYIDRGFRPTRLHRVHVSWWRHQMEAFSALLALCAGNSPASGEFPAQRPVTRSFDVFFDLCLNKRLRKQWRGWWFETLLCPLWSHCNVPRENRVMHTMCNQTWP